MLACITSLQAQQTVQQTISIQSNQVNSTQIVMYKEDNSNYYNLVSNLGGFSIYDSNSASYRFHIHANGNVGIGTTSPGSKLAVNGNIRAREIKVENANWPDFVFAKSYTLPTLRETEAHIKQKGHLPGIPSAAEVKTNGVDLGDLNAKLLEKIEELTLHLIEKEKQIEKQNSLLKVVEDKNQDYESRLNSIERLLKDLKVRQ